MKILPFVTESHLALLNLKNIQMGKWHLKTNPYYHIANKSHLHNSYAFRSEDLKVQANGRSCTGLSTPFNDRLSFAFWLYQVCCRVHCRVTHWSSDSFCYSNSTGRFTIHHSPLVNFLLLRKIHKIFAQPHTIVKQICFPNGNVFFLSLLSLSNNA